MYVDEVEGCNDEPIVRTLVRKMGIPFCICESDQSVRKVK